MINTKGVSRFIMSKENILNYISDEEIFRKYIEHPFKVGEVFSAPYRKDRNPSFGVYYNEVVNRLLYKDLSLKEGGDCFSYVMKHVYNCNFTEALHKVFNDFKLDKRQINHIHINNEKQDKKSKKIDIIKQNFTQIDLNYWESFGISTKTLEFYNVHSCYEYYINGELKRRYTNNYPIYAYYFPRTGNYKIYLPTEDKYNKWRTNANNDWDIQGYDQLPQEGGLLFITKSMKDCMVLYELGYNAVATHGEGHYINYDFIRHLRNRFKKIIIFYDQDKAGIIGATYLKETFNIESIFIPQDYNCKDISDYTKLYGIENSKKLIIKLNGNSEEN